MNLKNHPFAVEAFFEHSIVLTFALPKEQLQPLIPTCLALDTYEDKWAFLAVALVQTKNLRPKGFPVFLGNDFFLIGYRIFVRYTSLAGKNLRGLYILKSETNRKKMEFLGNIFTHYQYSTTDIFAKMEEGVIEVSSSKSKFYIKAKEDNDNSILPQNSPFPDWKTARRFAGPLPFTFSYNKAQNSVLIIEGVRENWIPKPLAVKDFAFDFLQNQAFENAILANAFIIEDIPYFWKKGKIEQL